MHMRVCVSKSQKRTSDPLELESQVIVNHLTWVLGTELMSSLKDACALNCRDISSALSVCTAFES